MAWVGGARVGPDTARTGGAGVRPTRLVLVVAALTVGWVSARAAGAHAGFANRAYVFALGTVALHALITLIDRHATQPAPTTFDDAARSSGAPVERPARLLTLCDLAAVGGGNAQGAHFHLRPYLRTLVRDVLASRGVDLDRDQEAAELLGGPTWDLVRPDRPAPADGRGPGLDEATLLAVAASLEQIR
jgi:hypothetical protein